MLECVLTSCGKESLLSKMLVFRLAISVAFVVSNLSLRASSSSWDERQWDKQCQDVERGIRHFTKVDRSEGILDVKIGGKVRTGLSRTHVETKRRKDRWDRLQAGRKASLCALTGNLTSDERTVRIWRV